MKTKKSTVIFFNLFKKYAKVMATKTLIKITKPMKKGCDKI